MTTLDYSCGFIAINFDCLLPPSAHGSFDVFVAWCKVSRSGLLQTLSCLGHLHIRFLHSSVGSLPVVFLTPYLKNMTADLRGIEECGRSMTYHLQEAVSYSSYPLLWRKQSFVALLTERHVDTLLLVDKKICLQRQVKSYVYDSSSSGC